MLERFRGQICNGRITRPFEFDFPICYQSLSESTTLKDLLKHDVSMSHCVRWLAKSPYLCFEYEPPYIHTEIYRFVCVFYSFLCFFFYIFFSILPVRVNAAPGPISNASPQPSMRTHVWQRALTVFCTSTHCTNSGCIVGRHRRVRADLSPTLPCPRTISGQKHQRAVILISKP